MSNQDHLLNFEYDSSTHSEDHLLDLLDTLLYEIPETQELSGALTDIYIALQLRPWTYHLPDCASQ